jgi:hypothetical protein
MNTLISLGHQRRLLREPVRRHALLLTPRRRSSPSSSWAGSSRSGRDAARGARSKPSSNSPRARSSSRATTAGQARARGSPRTARSSRGRARSTNRC